MVSSHLRPIATFAAVKGIAIAAVTRALDVPFLKSLAIALVSGGLGAAGAIVAAVIAVRAARRGQQDVRDLKKAVGADKRETDHDNGNGE